MSDSLQYDGSGRSGRLDRVLRQLLTDAPEIEAAAVVSFDGLPMASALPAGMDEDRVAAMSAALLSLGERAAQGLGRGDLNQVYIEGEQGTVFLISADDEAVLVAVGSPGAKVGLMLFEARRAAHAVAVALRVAEAPAPAVDASDNAAEPMAEAVPDTLLQGTQPVDDLGYDQRPEPVQPAPPAYVADPPIPVGAVAVNVATNGYQPPVNEPAQVWPAYPAVPTTPDPTPWS